MRSARSSKTVTFADNYGATNNQNAYQNPQVKSEEDLKSRLVAMQRYLDSLKSQLDTEKTILQREKIELYNYTIHHQEANPGIKFPLYLNPITPNLAALTARALDTLSQPSKQHLKDIEEKCDTELERLQKYVENIKDLKSYWQYLKSQQVNELGHRWSSGSSSSRSLRQARRMHEGVPSAEWLHRNRTFV